MDNRNLFQFPFVNHFSEKDKIWTFLESESNHVLWLSGEHGIGKTFLLEQIEKIHGGYKKINLPIKASDTQPALFRFLLLLQNSAVTTISQFIGKNYEQLLNIGKEIAIQTLRNKGLDLETLVNITFDGTKMFVNNDRKDQSAQKVIINYIKDMSQKEKLLIIFDDFSLCDEKSTDFIIEIILQLIDDDNIKFIISTTPEELERRQNIQIMLMEKLPLTPLSVEDFKDEVFFYEILYNIFDLENVDKALVTELFIKCEGKPNRLKKFLRDLYCRNGINFLTDHRRAVWNRTIVCELLEKSINKNEFSTVGKLILNSVIAFNQLLPYDILYDAVMYFAETILHGKNLLENNIQQCFENFLNTDLLQIMENGRIIITQNSIAKEFQREMQRSATKSLFSCQVCSFLNLRKETILQNNIPYDVWNELMAHHSFVGKVSGWEKLNYNYAKKLCDKKYYEEASRVFLRIPFSCLTYNLNDYIMIINCYFESGKYDEARDVISVITDDLAYSVNQQIEYHLICSKVFNISLKKEKALEELEFILPLVEKEGEIYLEILNREQEILVDTYNGKERARAIFDQFVAFYKNGIKSVVIAKALKDSIDFYHANMALNYINIAENIFKQNNSTLNLGFLYTNRGFEHFRQGDIDSAKNDFQLSIDLLKDIRFYELSYPLNNMAACYMNDDNYERAISYIIQARLHNKSDYVDAVLKTQLMMCYCMLEKYNDAKNIAEELIKYIQKHHITDPTMLRKIYVNIGILYDMMGDDETAYKYVSENYNYAKKTSTWYRAYLIMRKRNPDLQNPLSHCIQTELAYWCKAKFEPWLVTFSHE